MKQMIASAIKFATEKHDGQFDKSGMPYILHPLKVMHYLKTDDEELMCIAVLHDVIEDCFLRHDDGIDNLRYIGMSERVIDAVHLLTKKKNVAYEDYLKSVSENFDALRVKLCDIRHNMDVRRLKDLNEKDMKRLEKYAKSYSFLNEKMKDHIV